MADSKHATGSFKIASWDEGPFAEHQDAPKLTAAKVIATYSGDIDGEGTSQSVMAYVGGADQTLARTGEGEGSRGERSGARCPWGRADGCGGRGSHDRSPDVGVTRGVTPHQVMRGRHTSAATGA